MEELIEHLDRFSEITNTECEVIKKDNIKFNFKR